MVSRSLLSQLTSKPKNKARNVCTLLGDRSRSGGRYFAREKGLHCYPNISKIPKIKIPGRIARSYIRCPSAGAQAQVSRSASQRSARRPGMKQYSPPRLTTKAGSPLRWRWIGCFGMVNSRPSLLFTSGSFSAGAPMNLPSFTHSLWTNSNCRSRCAPTKANMRPRSAPSSSRTPGAAAGHSWCRV